MGNSLQESVMDVVAGAAVSAGIRPQVAERSSTPDDSALFERLVQKHEDRLYRVAYRMTGSSEEAQDLLQDALIEAFRAFAHFKRGTYFDKWLYRIMSRTFIDRKRSQNRAKFISLDEPQCLTGVGGYTGRQEREVADAAADPARRLDRATLDHRIQDGLESLSPDHRLVLILSDIEEFSYEEVAQFLSCPIGTVRSRLHRARAQMREHLTRSGYSI